MEDDSDYVKVTPQKMGMMWDNAQFLGVIIAIVAVIITLIIFALYKKGQSKRNGVLLLGLSDSGKTLIFAQLLHGKFVHTHTSVKENIGDYITKNSLFKIVDIPGHERLRGRFFDTFKSSAKGLVFVIDSGRIQKDVKDVAEYLYNCLSDSVIKRNLPSLLILCNKQDEPLAKGSAVIKTMLEKEINILRTTKTSQLMSIENTVNQVYLGKEGKDFEFSHLSPMRIDFGESCAVIQTDDSPVNIKDLTEWINSIR
ncbi:UNVERIFIED_CONTAM: hypothetical protein PYX00_010547 [Menopon gallinae]|uniref:Signal recognition particle receptor subunit beta n=1 Tax=Menopon gallinae TaxID=328185 RepID=A0AAW2HGB5_9NEOP